MAVNQVSIGSDNGHYLNQCWVIVNWIHRVFSEILTKIESFFIQENTSQNIVCDKVAILSRGRELIVSAKGGPGHNRTGTQSTSRWRHQMEKNSANWPFVRGIHRLPVNSPHKGQWRGALMFALLNKRLNKQSWGWWFETLSRPFWRHCNVVIGLG